MRYARDGFSVEAALRKGRKLPDWYLDEPPLLPQDGFYLKAFGELTTCRSSGMSLGPIPWTACRQYGHAVGLEPDMIDTFIFIIRMMDQQYREWQDAEAKRLAEQS